MTAITGRNAAGGDEILESVSGALEVTLATGIAGERNPGSATNSYLATYTPCNVTVCDGTGAVTIGAGAANDTHLLGVTIMLAAGPPTATIAGFADQAAAAKTIVITGSTSVDVNWFPPGGLINSKGALTVTGSVDDKVVVFWRAV